MAHEHFNSTSPDKAPSSAPPLLVVKLEEEDNDEDEEELMDWTFIGTDSLSTPQAQQPDQSMSTVPLYAPQASYPATALLQRINAFQWLGEVVTEPQGSSFNSFPHDATILSATVCDYVQGASSSMATGDTSTENVYASEWDDNQINQIFEQYGDVFPDSEQLRPRGIIQSSSPQPDCAALMEYQVASSSTHGLQSAPNEGWSDNRLFFPSATPLSADLKHGNTPSLCQTVSSRASSASWMNDQDPLSAYGVQQDSRASTFMTPEMSHWNNAPTSTPAEVAAASCSSDPTYGHNPSFVARYVKSDHYIPVRRNLLPAPPYLDASGQQKGAAWTFGTMLTSLARDDPQSSAPLADSYRSTVNGAMEPHQPVIQSPSAPPFLHTSVTSSCASKSPLKERSGPRRSLTEQCRASSKERTMTQGGIKLEGLSPKQATRLLRAQRPVYRSPGRETYCTLPGRPLPQREYTPPQKQANSHRRPDILFCHTVSDASATTGRKLVLGFPLDREWRRRSPYRLYGDAAAAFPQGIPYGIYIHVDIQAPGYEPHRTRKTVNIRGEGSCTMGRLVEMLYMVLKDSQKQEEHGSTSPFDAQGQRDADDRSPLHFSLEDLLLLRLRQITRGTWMMDLVIPDHPPDVRAAFPDAYLYPLSFMSPEAERRARRTA